MRDHVVKPVAWDDHPEFTQRQLWRSNRKPADINDLEATRQHPTHASRLVESVGPTRLRNDEVGLLLERHGRTIHPQRHGRAAPPQRDAPAQCQHTSPAMRFMCQRRAAARVDKRLYNYPVPGE